MASNGEGSKVLYPEAKMASNGEDSNVINYPTNEVIDNIVNGENFEKEKSDRPHQSFPRKLANCEESIKVSRFVTYYGKSIPEDIEALILKGSNEDIRMKFEPIILEYFENGDTFGVIRFIELKIHPDRRKVVVEQLIDIAMDHKPSHREKASVLISALFPRNISDSDICSAFENLLANLNDLTLDIPDAPTILGNFIARAIADDCISPDFIITATSKIKYYQEALIRADTLLLMKKGLRCLHNIWGVSSTIRPVKALSREISLLLEQFATSADVEEASRCLRRLEIPYFHHEFVYEAVIMALKANDASKEEDICTLLKSLSDTILITPDQIESGFIRIFQDFLEIAGKIPMAFYNLDRFMKRCHEEGFLTKTTCLTKEAMFFSMGKREIS